MSVTSTPMYVNEPEVTVACTTTSGSTRVALGKVGAQTIEIKNISGVEAFIRVGDSTVTAATTDTSIPTGAILVYTKLIEETHVAGITASGTATLRVKSGQGI